jgi:hypothetical protein
LWFLGKVGKKDPKEYLFWLRRRGKKVCPYKIKMNIEHRTSNKEKIFMLRDWPPAAKGVLIQYRVEDRMEIAEADIYNRKSRGDYENF